MLFVNSHAANLYSLRSSLSSAIKMVPVSQALHGKYIIGAKQPEESIDQCLRACLQGCRGRGSAGRWMPSAVVIGLLTTSVISVSSAQSTMRTSPPYSLVLTAVSSTRIWTIGTATDVTRSSAGTRSKKKGKAKFTINSTTNTAGADSTFAPFDARGLCEP